MPNLVPHPLVALTSPGLLRRLLLSAGRHWYRLEPGFADLGDADD